MWSAAGLRLESLGKRPTQPLTILASGRWQQQGEMQKHVPKSLVSSMACYPNLHYCTLKVPELQETWQLTMHPTSFLCTELAQYKVGHNWGSSCLSLDHLLRDTVKYSGGGGMILWWLVSQGQKAMKLSCISYLGVPSWGKCPSFVQVWADRFKVGGESLSHQG